MSSLISLGVKEAGLVWSSSVRYLLTRVQLKVLPDGGVLFWTVTVSTLRAPWDLSLTRYLKDCFFTVMGRDLCFGSVDMVLLLGFTRVSQT